MQTANRRRAMSRADIYAIRLRDVECPPAGQRGVEGFTGSITDRLEDEAFFQSAKRLSDGDAACYEALQKLPGMSEQTLILSPSSLFGIAYVSRRSRHDVTPPPFLPVFACFHDEPLFDEFRAHVVAAMPSLFSRLFHARISPLRAMARASSAC